jgi:hypothetical protein
MKRPARPDPAHLQMKCDLFNVRNPVGTAVTVKKDDMSTPDGFVIVETITTSQAEVLSGHSAVIWLKDISGCYLLDRVTPVAGGAA